MKNKVELIGVYGDDMIHACSAWTSTSRELDEKKIGRMPALLKMLAEAGHHTPFEKSSLHFLVDTDIASHIHILKHRIGVSVNAESARYKELKEDKYYIPEDWHYRWQEELEEYTKKGLVLYHKCIESLVAEGMDRKRAKESARFFRTYNTQIAADVMFNFRSFVHFLELRNKPDAQKEIREIAAEMLQQVKNTNKFPHTIAAFNL
jgi:flavin-dependent thymidylate synthase